jgi:hypothetical protein
MSLFSVADSAYLQFPSAFAPGGAELAGTAPDEQGGVKREEKPGIHRVAD